MNAEYFEKTQQQDARASEVERRGAERVLDVGVGLALAQEQVGQVVELIPGCVCAQRFVWLVVVVAVVVVVVAAVKLVVVLVLVVALVVVVVVVAVAVVAAAVVECWSVVVLPLLC
jgi:hypothetical protein